MAREPLFFVHVPKAGGTSVVRSIVHTLGPGASVYPRGSKEEMQVGKVEPARLLQDARNQQFDFISVHMPAWVAAEVAPSGTHVTVLRDPVSRTISHLRQVQRTVGHHGFEISIEALYDDPHLRALLANYQVWIFASPRCDVDPHWEHDAARGQALLRDARELAANDPDASPPAWMYGMATHRNDTTPQGENDVSVARRVLESFHAVGVTPELDAFGAKVSKLSGLTLPIAHRNRTEGSFACPETLRAKILADNALDAELYDAAVELSHRAGSH